MTSSESTRRSQLDLFSPPDGSRRGVFGLVCGLSAEESFMRSALDRFTLCSSRQRIYTGHFALALFQDIHNQPIRALPGLYNPYPAKHMPEKIKLIHAKVALLGFGLSAVGEPDYYRLIVSTGNWTREAVNSSINLTWVCDYSVTGRDDQRQNASDLLEAVVFWRQLLGINEGMTGFYQLDDPARRRVESFTEGLTDRIGVSKGQSSAESLLARVRSWRRPSSRFISNLLDDKAPSVDDTFQADSMGAQVIRRFRRNWKRRNFIVCGSGFYEEAISGHEEDEPEVTGMLVRCLSDQGILTDVPRRRWLVINRNTCGAVGCWIKRKGIQNVGWEICRPKHPDFKKVPYPFHAKYLFIGHDNGNSITRGLLYLGSGNLSRQGFALGPGTGGNIEAGVIITTEKYYDAELCTALGIDAEDNFEDKDIPNELEGEESEQPETKVQVPPPIASCVWKPKLGLLVWEWLDSGWHEVLLNGWPIRPEQTEISVANDACADFSSGIKLSGKKDGSFEWFIPVFTEGDAFCPPPVRPRGGRDIIDILDSFPQDMSEDDDDDVGDDGVEGWNTSVAPATQDAAFSEFRDELDHFPLHFATTLIERIAQKNQQLSPGEMPDWIAHLRRTLTDGMKCETKAQLVELDPNMLFPLLDKQGFAPKQQPDSAYVKAIQDIMEDWRRAAGVMTARGG